MKRLAAAFAILALASRAQQKPKLAEIILDKDGGEMTVGNQTVSLKHVAPSKMIGAGTEAGIVIQAVRSLGEKGVHEIPVHTLAKRLPGTVKRAVKRLTPTAPAWSQAVLNQITA